MTKPVVFDLDDLCDLWDPYERLLEWKERVPGGRVTLFTIPRRSSDALLAKYAALPWVDLAMHGWWHHRGECLWWAKDKTAERLKVWEDAGFARIFKAPGWESNKEVHDACFDRGWIVAEHVRNRPLWEGRSNVYVYNRPLRRQKFMPLHGHTHDTQGNGVAEKFEMFCAPSDAAFLPMNHDVCNAVA